MNEQIEVYVSNLPNNALQKDIIDYLSIAGPIVRHKFNEDGQKLSVNVIYCNLEAAQIAKRYLGEKQFMGRDLKISVDLKKNQQSEDQLLNREISKLTNQQKKKVLSYLKKLKNTQGKMFEIFLQKNPKITSSLLNLR